MFVISSPTRQRLYTDTQGRRKTTAASGGEKFETIFGSTRRHRTPRRCPTTFMCDERYRCTRDSPWMENSDYHPPKRTLFGVRQRNNDFGLFVSRPFPTLFVFANLLLTGRGTVRKKNCIRRNTRTFCPRGQSNKLTGPPNCVFCFATVSMCTIIYCLHTHTNPARRVSVLLHRHDATQSAYR